MLILTNFQRFPERWRSSQGISGEAIHVDTAWQVLKLSRGADLIIINCDVKLTYQLALLYTLLPFLRRPVLSHDIVLRKPLTPKGRLITPLKKLLLARIDRFSHYFRALDGYNRYYGIGPERSSYVTFKPSIRYRNEYKVGPDGEYILCLGKSERDYDTFFQAVERLPDLPGAIPTPDFEQFSRHASRFTYPLSALPANVRVLEDEGTAVSLLRMIERAHLVVLPIVGSRIAPSGIGTYLNAMLMGKCVITTEGPGASDVLTGEALMVPPEDAGALAAMIRKVWDDDDLRRRTAIAGQVYAERCGGEPELRQRVLDCAIEHLGPGKR